MIKYIQKANKDISRPRVLIVNAYFTDQSGNGNYLGRLFSCWSNDEVATISRDYAEPDLSRCKRHYQVGDKEIRIFKFFEYIIKKNKKKQSAQLKSKKYIECRKTRKNILHNFIKYLGIEELFYSIDISDELYEWIMRFKPDVVYGVCSNLNSIRFLYKINKKLNLPFILHFMDDWPSNLYLQSITSRFLRLTYLKEFNDLVKISDISIAICKEMATEYKKRYNREILYLPMPVELRQYDELTKKCFNNKSKKFKIRYGGRVGWAIRESLADIAIQVDILNKEGFNIVFDIVTFQMEMVPEICYKIDAVKIEKPGPLSDLPKYQSESDLLLICYDFDNESYRQARYSMPSKLADCMASGTPILVYGPKGLPVVEYARREGWGSVVDIRSAKRIKDAISELVQSHEEREILSSKAKILSIKKHDSEIISRKFCKIIMGLEK
jgi:glycosyltransferase involved in cell wall biosynthesis